MEPDCKLNWSELFFQLLRIRLVEERIAGEYSRQEMRCPVHLSTGQEAVAVGVCSALQAKDEVMSGHRSHAHYLAKGGSLKAMLAELMGRQGGCAHGLGGSMHLIDLEAGFRGAVPIVGSTIPIATGLAFQHQLDRDRKLTATFFGEGATEEGVFAESLNFAAIHKLPLIFVCENNLYSVYSPMHVRQSASRSIVDIARANGIWAEPGDGNRVDEVFRLASAAVDRANAGEGASLLLLDTYRWREHCGPNYDNHLGYRTEAEFEQWRPRCPVEYASSQVEEAERQHIRSRIEAEIEAAFRYVRAQPEATLPSLESLVFTES